MESSERARDAGVLNLASTFLESFPPSARLPQEDQLASLERVREDGLLTIRVAQQGNELVVRAAGELDIASAKSLEEELLSAIEGGASAINLDLGDLSFIDSTGLRVLLQAGELTVRNGKRFEIVKASRRMREAWEMSGLESAFPLPD
jgi:anti-anti-sigma factor